MSNEIKQKLLSLLEPKSMMFGIIILFYLIRLDDALTFARVPTCSVNRPSPWLVSIDVLFLLIPLLGLWLRKSWGLLIGVLASALVIFGVIDYLLFAYASAAGMETSQWNWELLKSSITYVFQFRAYYFVLVAVSALSMILSLQALWSSFRGYWLKRAGV